MLNSRGALLFSTVLSRSEMPRIQYRKQDLDKVMRRAMRITRAHQLFTYDYESLERAARRIATTAPSTAARAATRPRMAADRPGIPSLARSACLMKAGLG